VAASSRDAILRRLKELSTESLMEMLRQRDTSKWREEVFEIAQRLLEERQTGRSSGRTVSRAPHAVVVTPPAPAPEPPVSPVHTSATAFDEARADALAVYCSDGRFDPHFDRFLAETLNTPHCDRLAVPGGPALLAGRLASYWESSGVENQVRFLVEAHTLRRVVLLVHEDCGYYRHKLGLREAALEQAQREDVAHAARRVARLAEGMRVTGFMARRREDKVVFEIIPLAETDTR